MCINIFTWTFSKTTCTKFCKDEVYIVFCLHTPDALKELSQKYNERAQVFEDFHVRLHELSPLEVLKEFTDLYKSWLIR